MHLLYWLTKIVQDAWSPEAQASMSCRSVRSKELALSGIGFFEARCGAFYYVINAIDRYIASILSELKVFFQELTNSYLQPDDISVRNFVAHRML
jgi:hypothetical protein